MLKRKKRNVLFLTLSLLLLAVLIGSLLPKTTFASMLQLDKKEQIVKIELGSKIDLLPPGKSHEWRDITGTPLGDRYLDAFFKAPCGPCDWSSEYFVDLDCEAAAIRFTLDHLPADYPFAARQYTVAVGFPVPEPEGDGYFYHFSLNYTLDAQMRMQDELNRKGIGEAAKSEERYDFTLPKSELFTPEFIGSQFE